jgi:hypothetical protein
MRFSAQTAATFFVTACVLLAAAGKGSGWITPLQEPGPRKKDQSTQSSNPISVAYCDLLRKPDFYDRKLIRVKAIYSAHFEMSALRDPTCSRDFLWTWVDFDEKHPTCTKPEVSESFEAAVASNNPETTEEDTNKAEVVFVGLFEVAHHLEIRNKIPTNAYGHMGMYRFQLTVSCIEGVKPLSPK